MRRRARALWMAGALGVGGVSGCAAGATNTPLPPDPPVLRVEMGDYSFGFRRPVPAGRVVFDVGNAGRRDHELVVVELPADMAGGIDAQLHSAERRAFPTVVALTARPPGGKGTFALDLAPGRYAMLCMLKDPGTAEEHALRGMNAEFRVERSGPKP
ncbi:MAG TPA: hypothetical protein VM142_12510 [Acidimicrobiales bacterium]|nr:hypothetical protein [Acidimicrobiales bacterium]